MYEYKGCDYSSIANNETSDCMNQTLLNFVEGDSSKLFKYNLGLGGY